MNFQKGSSTKLLVKRLKFAIRDYIQVHSRLCVRIYIQTNYCTAPLTVFFYDNQELWTIGRNYRASFDKDARDLGARLRGVLSCLWSFSNQGGCYLDTFADLVYGPLIVAITRGRDR